MRKEEEKKEKKKIVGANAKVFITRQHKSKDVVVLLQLAYKITHVPINRGQMIKLFMYYCRSVRFFYAQIFRIILQKKKMKHFVILNNI
jgi:hypothetical protein